MSFPRARTKRFNEEVGCAPGVGHYNPKLDKKASNVVFNKTSRFQDANGGSGMSDNVFATPKTLVKCDVTCLTSSIHERLYRSSSSSLGSQECLLPKNQLGLKSRSVSERSLQNVVDQLESALKEKDIHITQLLQVIARLEENETEAEQLHKTKLDSLEKVVMQLLDIQDIRSIVSSGGSSTEQLDKLKSDLLQINAQFQNVMSEMKASRIKVWELESAVSDIDGISTNLKEIEERLELEIKAKEDLASKLEQWKNKYEQEKGDKRDLISNLERLAGKYEQEKKDKVDLVSELEALKKKQEQNDKELKELNEQYKLAMLDLQVKELEIQQFQNGAKETERTEELLSRDLDNLQFQLDSAHKEVDRLQKELQDSLKENANLEQHFETTEKSLSRDLENLQSELDSTCKEVDRLQKELQTSLKENSNLEQRCKSNLDEVCCLNGQLSESSLQIDSLQQELQNKLNVYNQSLEEQTSNFKELELKFHSLTARNKETKSELDDKSIQIAYLKSTLEMVNSELVSSKREMENVQRQWTQAVNSFQVLVSEKNSLEDLCQNLKADISYKDESLKQLSIDVKKKEEAFKLIESVRLENEITITELKYQLDYLQTALQKSDQEKQCLIGELLEKESSIAELENIGVEVESVVIVLRSDLQQKEEELRNVEEKWNQCSSCLKEALNEIKQKDNRMSNLESSLVRCQDKLQESLSEVANLSRQLCAVDNKQAQLSTTNELLKLELATKDDQLEAAMESVREADRKQQFLRDEIQELAEELQMKTVDLERFQSQPEKWKQMYERLEARVAPFKEQLDDYARERDNLIQENDQAFKELSDIHDKYAKMMGHQNHKQKIQYLLKQKEEIIRLKKENSQLRASRLTPKKGLPKRNPNSARKEPLKSMENTPAYF